MKLKNVLISSVSILFALMLAGTSYAQHPVLFETFGSIDVLCDLPFPYYRDVNSVMNDPEGKKVIHLEYNIADYSNPLCEFNSGALAKVGATLYPSSGKMSNIYFGSVDRTILPVTDTQAETEQNNVNWVGDMETQIDAQSSKAPPATMQFVSATLDQSRPNDFIFTANVAVNAPSGTSDDSIIIHYAVVEDKVIIPSTVKECAQTPTSFDDIVRWITTGDSIVFLSNAPSGTKNVSFQQASFIGAAQTQIRPILKNMRFIAFLESGGQIVNAADLKDDLSTVPAPQASISIVNSDVDDSIFNPGYIAPKFIAINVPIVNEYYSIDNGTTWILAGDSIPINSWPYTSFSAFLPDTEISKTGKIKIVDVSDPNVSAIQDGTFSIKVHPSINLLHPQNTDTLAAAGSFLIQWIDTGVSTVKLEYALAPDFDTWVQIADKVHGESYTWTPVPDTNYYAKVRISDDNTDVTTGAADQVSDPFEIRKNLFNGVASNPTLQSGLTITSIAPNPAQNGEQLVVRYADQNAPSIKLEMLDLLGHTVVTQTLQSSQSGEADIPTQTLYAGTYIVRLNDGTNTVTKRVEIIR